MKVGLIGLGHMGAGMAANLLKAGHEVTVYNRTRANAELLAAQGAKVAIAPSDACGGDAVICAERRNASPRRDRAADLCRL